MKAKLEKSVGFVPRIVNKLEGLGTQFFRANLMPEIPEIKVIFKLKVILSCTL
jgi:hypothetical protein